MHAWLVYAVYVVWNIELYIEVLNANILKKLKYEKNKLGSFQLPDYKI